MGKKKEKRAAKKLVAAEKYMDMYKMFRGMSRRERKRDSKVKLQRKLNYKADKLRAEYNIANAKDLANIASYESANLRKKEEGLSIKKARALPLPDEVKRNIFSFIRKY